MNNLYTCPHCDHGILALDEITVGDPPYDLVRPKPCSCTVKKSLLREKGMDVEGALDATDYD